MLCPCRGRCFLPFQFPQSTAVAAPAKQLLLLLLLSSCHSHSAGVLLHRELCERTIIVEFIDFRAKNHVINLISSSLCPGQSETQSTDSLAGAHPAVELLLYDEQLWSLKRNNQSLPQFLLLIATTTMNKRRENLCTIFFYRLPPTPSRVAVKKEAVRIHDVTHYRRHHLHRLQGKVSKGCESK